MEQYWSFKIITCHTIQDNPSKSCLMSIRDYTIMCLSCHIIPSRSYNCRPMIREMDCVLLMLSFIMARARAETNINMAKRSLRKQKHYSKWAWGNMFINMYEWCFTSTTILFVAVSWVLHNPMLSYPSIGGFYMNISAVVKLKNLFDIFVHDGTK